MGEPRIGPEELRDVDQEAANPRLHQQPRRQERIDEPIVPRPRTNVASLLRLVEDLSISSDFQQISTFVPSAKFLGRVLQETSIMMNEDFRLMRNHPDYHPIMYTLYVNTLWIIQVLRVKVSANTATATERHLLRNCVEAGFLEFRIPGPLVLFFQALSFGTPCVEKFGIICPTLPVQFGISADAADLGDLYANILPPLPYLRHAYAAMRVRFTNQNRGQWANEDWRCYSGAVVAQAAAAPVNFDHTNALNRHVREARLFPSLSLIDELNDQLYKNSITRFIRYPINVPAPPGAGNATIAQYLGFDQAYRWFADLGNLLSWVPEYWKNSERLASIATHANCPGQFISVGNEVFANNDDLRDHFGVTLDFSAEVWTPQMSPDELTAKQAAFTQINWRPPPNVALNMNIGVPNVAGSTLVGPFWTRNPDSIVSSTIVPTLGLRTVLAEMVN
jgi:hypothetical protein